MRINGLKSNIIVKIFLSRANFFKGHVILKSYVTQFGFGLEKLVNLVFNLKLNIKVVS